MVSLKRLEGSMISQFGEEFIRRTDRAYQLGKTSNWIRFSVLDGYLDMPISRHILLIMFLFGDLANFKEKILIASDPDSEPPSLRLSNEDAALRKRAYREKILQVRKRWPHLGANEFWKKAYKATKWLYEYDNRWLLSVIDPNSMPSDISASRDSEYASNIERNVERLYSIGPEKPLRVNNERMLNLLPKKVKRGQGLAIDYPLVSSQLEQNYESLWHFHVRKTLWAIMEMARLNISPASSSLRIISGVNHYHTLMILDHYDIDLAEAISARYDPQFQLTKLSVSNRFEGPPGADKIRAGRMYKKKGKQAG